MRSIVLVVSVAISGVAAAQSGPDSHLMTEEQAVEREGHEDPDVSVREVPNYDGRTTAPTSPGRKLLWIPRLIVAPMYFLTEFVLRRPLSKASRLAEQSTSDPLRFFVFGKRQQVAVAPTLLVDFGDSPSAGFYLRVNEVFHPDFKMRYRFATWGRDWLRLTSVWRWEPLPHERYRFELVFDVQRRADGRYYGLGSEIEDVASRFQYRMYDLMILFEAEPWRASQFRAYVGFRERRFSNRVDRGTPIEERVAQGAFTLPSHYNEGYWAWAQGFEMILNTRRERPHNSSGVLMRIHGEHAFDLEDLNGARWVHYGGSLGAFVDLAGGHVLALHVSAHVVESLSGDVPFTETIDLGGQGPMRGFRTGHLRGQSATSAVLQYSWPVWAYLDGLAHIGLGNVYDGRFENFALDQQRMSFGLGFGALYEVDHRFDFTIAWGTEPIANGFKVISTRIAVGSTLEF